MKLKQSSSINVN